MSIWIWEACTSPRHSLCKEVDMFLCRSMLQPHPLSMSQMSQNEIRRSKMTKQKAIVGVRRWSDAWWTTCVSSPSGQRGRWWLPSAWPSGRSSWREPAWAGPPGSSRSSAACYSHVLWNRHTASRAGRITRYLVETDTRGRGVTVSLYSLCFAAATELKWKTLLAGNLAK